MHVNNVDGKEAHGDRRRDTFPPLADPGGQGLGDGCDGGTRGWFCWWDQGTAAALEQGTQWEDTGGGGRVNGEN